MRTSLCERIKKWAWSERSRPFPFKKIVLIFIYIIRLQKIKPLTPPPSPSATQLLPSPPLKKSSCLNKHQNEHMYMYAMTLTTGLLGIKILLLIKNGLRQISIFLWIKQRYNPTTLTVLEFWIFFIIWPKNIFKVLEKPLIEFELCVYS